MNILRAMRRPEYMLRPAQIVKRLAHFRHASTDELDVVLPWGLGIRVSPNEAIGRAIATLGLDDLPVCEVLWRLVPPGGTTVDVGANIGQMTSIMALRAGPDGTVFALEPESRNLALLRHNVGAWTAAKHIARIIVVDQAASDVEGEACLFLPAAIAGNRGLASLHRPAGGTNYQRIKTAPLSKILHGTEHIDVLKIDVEGTEDAVVRGYLNEITAGRVTHIVAEEHRPLPSLLSKRLEDLGLRCFVISGGFRGPFLWPVASNTQRPRDRATSILATRDPVSVVRTLEPKGWTSLAKPRDFNSSPLTPTWPSIKSCPLFA
jgi:FkbM family methyltransferase